MATETLTTEQHYGLEIDTRVIEADGESTTAGTIVSFDDENSTCHVRWDNGHNNFEVPIDCLCPVDGW
jgi:hypothetical protein